VDQRAEPRGLRAEASGVWVVRLRWGMLAAGPDRPDRRPLDRRASLRCRRSGSMVGVLAATNAVLAWRHGQGPPGHRGWCGAALAFDTCK
jgi:hypothetical protein